MMFVLAVAAGFAAGVVSAWGVGGGTLLVLCMAIFTQIPQQSAQGINLLYFLPVSAAALVSHVKNGLIVKRAVVPAIIAGVPAAIIGAIVATQVETEVLRKVFGAFVLVVGLFELFAGKKVKKDKEYKQ